MPPAGGLRALLPPYVVVAARADLTDDGSAFAGEVSASAGMAPERRAEFRTGRALARSALADLGRPASAILVGPSREPVWPTGVVGSITHCPGFYGAAVALDTDLAALGIDAEPALPLPPEVLPLVGTPAELAGLRRLDLPDRLLFCAKEAVFKAWYPTMRTWLDLLDVTLSFDAGGSFRVVPVRDDLVDTPTVDWLTGLTGTWSAPPAHLLCAAWSVPGAGPRG